MTSRTSTLLEDRDVVESTPTIVETTQENRTATSTIQLDTAQPLLGGLTMLVANDGGHLMQLHTLAGRLGLTDVLWATIPTSQSRSLLAGQDVVWTGSAATRDWRAVLRNRRQLRKVLKERRPARVISTGSSLALSALPQAARMGIDAHYIESVTRTEGFSLSGRILAHCQKVKLYTQWPHLADMRWSYRGSVLDGFEMDAASAKPVERVVVSLGTQGFGFRRLLDRLVKVIPDDVEVLWQTGPTDTDGLDIDARPSVPNAEFHEAIENADVLISHAGAGIALTALGAGKMPLLVPRRVEFDEHIDDHQQQISRSLSNRGLATAGEPEDLTWDDVQAAAQNRAVMTDKPAPYTLD